ncbi:MAG: hypothetical protein AUK03_12270 [Anaerolineae bacterium CG2_30_64_16]|nr:MAG: hypothetical protein AUK03_12270 [Anaerolineae bacterium CG2_30_64_16]
MRPVAGILLIIFGVSFPLGMLFWLNGRMKRTPALAPRQVGLLLAFNGVLPVGVIALGLGLISASAWDALAFRLVLLLSASATVVLLVTLWLTGRATRRTGGEDDG